MAELRNASRAISNDMRAACETFHSTQRSLTRKDMLPSLPAALITEQPAQEPISFPDVADDVTLWQDRNFDNVRSEYVQPGADFDFDARAPLENMTSMKEPIAEPFGSAFASGYPGRMGGYREDAFYGSIPEFPGGQMKSGSTRWDAGITLPKTFAGLRTNTGVRRHGQPSQQPLQMQPPSRSVLFEKQLSALDTRLQSLDARFRQFGHS